jgi:hypothetical protein
MKAKLIKTESGYNLFTQGFLKGSTEIDLVNQLNIEEGNIRYHLSKQNCDKIFGVVDVIDVVYKQVRNGFDGVIDSFTEAFAKECINKAMELMGDKIFTLDDIHTVFIMGREGMEDKMNRYVTRIHEPTEWDVEIEMECLDPNCDGINKKGVCIPGDKPKLDENGCLILKKL